MDLTHHMNLHKTKMNQELTALDLESKFQRKLKISE